LITLPEVNETKASYEKGTDIDDSHLSKISFDHYGGP